MLDNGQVLVLLVSNGLVLVHHEDGPLVPVGLTPAGQSTQLLEGVQDRRLRLSLTARFWGQARSTGREAEAGLTPEEACRCLGRFRRLYGNVMNRLKTFSHDILSPVFPLTLPECVGTCCWRW